MTLADYSGEPDHISPPFAALLPACRAKLVHEFH
jgi:hypothetical protein